MTELNSPTDDGKVSKRFHTPIFDSLSPMHQTFVMVYCDTLDKVQAGLAAGYSDKKKQLLDTIRDRVLSKPEVVAAIDELLASRLEQLSGGQAALCVKLLNQSLASIFDVCEMVPYQNGNGTVIEGKFSLIPKPLHAIEARFLPAVNFIRRNTDGTYGWDNVSQHRAATLLSSLMMWDQKQLDQAPQLIFNFGGIQEEPYERPDETIELGELDPGEDEVHKLTH